MVTMPMLALTAIVRRRRREGGSRASYHAGGDQADVGVAGQALAQHHELVATDAGHGVRRGRSVRTRSRDLDQQLVPGSMAQAVVDDLEPVEVDEAARRPGRCRVRSAAARSTAGR